MMLGQEYLTGIVPDDEFDECFRWAFGDDVESLLTHNKPDAWNQRHGELFTIEGSDAVEGTTKKIGRAYMESKKNENREVPAQVAT